MIPGNEPAGDGRFVGITTVTVQQWQALARLIGRPDQADDDELGTMIGRFRRAEEVNGAIHAYTRRHTADEIVAACVDARVPAAIVGNGAELPRNEQLAARNVFVRQPGESWIRPRAPFRFHCGRRSSPSPRPRGIGRMAGPGVARAGPGGIRRSAAGRYPCPRLHRVLGGPVRDGVVVVDGCGCHQGRSRAAAGRDPVQRRSAAARRSALLREVGALPRVQSRQARHHTRPRQSRRARAGEATGRAQRRRRGELHAAGVGTLRARLGHRPRAEPAGDHAADAGLRARWSVARPRRLRADDGAAHRHGVGHGLRRWTADHPGRSGRPDGRRARRTRGDRRTRAPPRGRVRGSS